MRLPLLFPIQCRQTRWAQPKAVQSVTPRNAWCRRAKVMWCQRKLYAVRKYINQTKKKTMKNIEYVKWMGIWMTAVRTLSRSDK